MISVVTWKWSTPGYRTHFTAEHVNALARACRRHYHPDVRVIVVTNDRAGIESSVEIVADTEDFASLPSPHGGNNPSCYRRIRAFHPDAAQWFGERFVSIDLDTLIVDDVRALWDRGEDFVGLQDPMRPQQLNGGMFLLRAGSRPHVWQDFGPGSPAIARRAGFSGSDQAWLSYCLPQEPRWTRADGVVSYRVDCREGLPAGAKVVSFHGQVKQWSSGVAPWVRPHWGP